MSAKSLVNGFNSGIVALTKVPGLGPLMRKSFVEITYVGRRSGKSFTTPVNFRRSGDSLVIGVALPDRKKWWRNFTGDGGPITLHLPGGDRRGHALAQRDERGRVTVRVRLEDSTVSPGNAD
ncbi:PNPOx family protein [Nocardia callitridis]|uniref:Nitroreductase family deazaflavin-dependent oxidoreductase n=1 Tax=Nocardia callitridis TaxID=648753 RepID=A0ABP9KIX8_9NOCA